MAPLTGSVKKAVVVGNVTCVMVASQCFGIDSGDHRLVKRDCWIGKAMRACFALTV